jgi:glycosyltransferase involved in cell wall biosynthesis
MNISISDKNLEPTICLNMIVKNESKIITRLFDSVVSIIDCYCICDTGSTDNTVEIIKKYFQAKNIPGKIIHEPFKNFAYNRNFSIQSCLYMSNYILLIDADMILQNNNFNKSSIKDDIYYILQGTEEFYYKNVRIVKNNGLYNYVGVTHEYINSPPNSIISDIDKTKLFIVDIGDGGAKADKYERDVKLLLNGIIDEPNMSDRYYFYLANSYYDSGKFEDAIETYTKKIKIGGWEQEIWYSYYRIGLSYKKLGKIEHAIHNWMMCHEAFPLRIENLYEIINYYRDVGNVKIAFFYYKMAKNILKDVTNKDKDSYLFLYNDMYVFKLDYEFSIIASYLGINNINNEVNLIFNHCNDFIIINNLLSNMKFYKYIFKSSLIVDLNQNINSQINGDHKTRNFKSSSSSIIPNKLIDGYSMNIRYVNYSITPEGNYLDCDDHIMTLNKYIELDKNFKVTKEFFIPLNYENRRYIGIEDIRIFNHSNTTHFIGTGFHQNNKIGIVLGEYLYNNELSFHEISPSFKDWECEKNWVYFQSSDNELSVLYNWFPLTIGKINKSDKDKFTLDISKTNNNLPKIFRLVRGSTNGFSFNNEIWFVVHIVSYENPRYYYHMLCVFDHNMNFLRNSFVFKFEGEPIEYCLGLIIEENRVIMTYSTWDRTTKLAIYDKKYIDQQFF